MTWVLNGIGALLVAAALHDIFRTVWYPRGFGGFVRRVCRLTWRLGRAWNHRTGGSTELAGPVALVVTVAAWATLITFGFALVYLPHLPGDFFASAALDADSRTGFWTAVYVSLTAVTTLGLGDLTPEHPMLRLLVPLEALLGFVLLTAAISWVLQVYPALNRRRTVALQLSHLDTPATYRVVREGDPRVACRTLDTVTQGVTTSDTDLSVYTESYYFRESDSQRALPAGLGVALRLAREGSCSDVGEVRWSAATLQSALDNLAGTLARDYLRTEGTTPEIIQAFAHDHQQPLTATD